MSHGLGSMMAGSQHYDEDEVTGHYQNLHLNDDDTGHDADSGPEQDLLSRDHQSRNAYYDYASEKSLTHVDSKLFYQSHQKEQQSSEDSLRMSGDLTNDRKAVPGVSPVEKVSSHPRESAHSLPRISSKPGLDVQVGDIQSPGLQTYNASATYDPQGMAPMDPGIAQVIGAAAPASISGDFPARDAAFTAELAAIYASVREILELRRKFIGLSLQGEGENPRDDPSWEIYPPPPEPVWNDDNNFMSPTTSSAKLRELSSPAPSRNAGWPASGSSAMDENGSNPPRRYRKPGQDIGEDFEISDLLPLPGPSDLDFELDESGIFQVFSSCKASSSKARIIEIPTIRDYYVALDRILQISSDGPTKSFAYRRLQYLEGKYNLYFLQYEYQELADSKRVPHRDFYNVRKVDTHVHHSSCMNQKHLLRFIKSKMKKCPDEEVLDRDGKLLTLREVFESINLTAYDLSIDTLDMHVSLKKTRLTLPN